MTAIQSGSFEILMVTPNALELIERAARTCYRSEQHLSIDESTRERFIGKIVERGHESVLEHASATVLFKGVSRGATHEMVRHRLSSYSHESTRYVNQMNATFVLPPDRTPDEGVQLGGHVKTIQQLVDNMFQVYDALLHAGWRKEDARQFLPIGTGGDIVMTANFREWLHIFQLRCDRAAHWEIRALMTSLRTEFSKRWPCIFQTCAPA